MHSVARIATPQRRVVVTGLGAVTPLAAGVKETWRRLIAGECAIQKVGDALASFPCKVAAFVPRGTAPGEFDVDKFVPPEDQRRSSPFIDFAMAATAEALADAQWFPQDEPSQDRTGVAVGAGMGSIEDIMATGRLLDAQSYRKVSPHFIPKILINLAAGYISIKYGFRGPNHAASTACATGAHAIGDAYRFIKYGDADVMVAGGTEASINPISFAGFCRAKAMSTKYNETPALASRPFDRGRDGFIMGEGAGIVVLEELEHALQRGAKIYGEVSGYGLSGDAHHVTAPRPDGIGARRAMEGALRWSGLSPQDIQYINAHATSTPIGDTIEVVAIKKVFGTHADRLAVSSTKGAVGHLLGAAGAVESIFTILALSQGIAPPTVNLESPDASEAPLNFVPKVAQKMNIEAALNNSFGFGGTNASVLFTKYPS